MKMLGAYTMWFNKGFFYCCKGQANNVNYTKSFSTLIVIAFILIYFCEILCIIVIAIFIFFESAAVEGWG